MKNKKIDIKYLPMDMGRVFYFLFYLFYRPIKLDKNGNKYIDSKKGASIIVANHTRLGDPLALGVCFCYRRVYFLTAKEVMKNKLVNFLLKGMGCIKIDRDIYDIDAMNKSTEILKNGKRLVMFPQGKIDKSDGIDAVKSGAVLLSIRTDAPIIPAYSLPRKHFYNRRIFIIGNEINCKELINKKIPSVSDIEKVSAIMKDELCVLKSIYEREVF